KEGGGCHVQENPARVQRLARRQVGAARLRRDRGVRAFGNPPPRGGRNALEYVPHRGIPARRAARRGEEARPRSAERRYRPAQEKRIHRRRAPGGRRAGGRDQPPRGGAEVRPHRGRPPAEGLVRLALVARVGGKDAARSCAVQYFCGADEGLSLRAEIPKGACAREPLQFLMVAGSLAGWAKMQGTPARK